MEIDTWPNLVAMFFAQAAERGEQPFLWEKRDGTYRAMLWREAAEQVRGLATTLRASGLERGDRVLLLSQNSPRWAIADFAIMAAGGVTVPVYTTNTVGDHQHIIADSGARHAIVSTAALAQRFLAAIGEVGGVTRLIAMEPIEAGDVSGLTIDHWDDAVANDQAGDDVSLPIANIDRDDLAALIYTSGTGGVPKGVMLSHRSILANCVGAADILDEVGLDDEVFLSFLPLSHAYEHSAGLMFPVAIGAQIYFAERIDTLSANLLESRPTIMTAVPRLYELMRDRMLKAMAREGKLKSTLFHQAVETGRKRYEAPAAMSLKERLVDRVVDRLVRDKIRARFGGRLKALVSGGAPLNYEVGLFFTALGLRLLQGYGQTEAGPVIACNRVKLTKLRTVGPPLKGVELRIADDGEILVRGDLLMDGYWNHPDLSAETLRDGWLHTGDIGTVDGDGFLEITDRKKDIIVNSGGDTLSPQRIESVLNLQPEIEASMAVGDNRPHIVAMLVPTQEFMTEWARSKASAADLSTLAHDDAFRSAIGAAVDRANKGLAPAERVKRFVIADEAFTVDNGLMTPTMKPRRHLILDRWGSLIDGLYETRN